MNTRLLPALLLLAASAAVPSAEAGSVPVRARNGMVVSQNAIASQVGMEVMLAGGNAVDAAVATAFALAVVHPAAGNIGGGGFLLLRPAQGPAAVYDFREQAPAAATPTMFLKDGKYSSELHHDSHLAVGVPGTVAGLHMAWADNGRMPWKGLLQPAISLAREGFMVSDGLARSLREVLPEMKRYPASLAQFSRQGVPYEMGDVLQQPDLARTLERIAEKGARGFYDGETAELIEKEMKARGGLITREDLRHYTIYRRPPLRGTYRGVEILTVPPPSAGGVALLQCLNVLENYDVPAMGPNSSLFVHTVSEALRRAFADRVRFLGDPEHVKDMPVERLVSKEYAAALRKTIHADRASVSTPASFEWPAESTETTHFSVVDADRNVVALTTTIEAGYGSKIVVPGAGFLLNNEMGDFNAGPGLTDASGLVGSEPNLAGPGKRMLSSMTPTIVVREGRPYLVTGSPGGRTIPSTVLLTVLNVLDFGMNPQEAVDAPRFNHQWLPDEIRYERFGLSADTVEALARRGHNLAEVGGQGVAEAIRINVREGLLEGGCDRRAPDGAAVGR
ncbi:MAG TPA: gamma-glutamyltransferase [Vicinamibacteria bacterium]|nr:gamma-glutamyltransferase [Vicinamibacteria bacterium]